MTTNEYRVMTPSSRGGERETRFTKNFVDIVFVRDEILLSKRFDVDIILFYGGRDQQKIGSLLTKYLPVEQTDQPKDRKP